MATTYDSILYVYKNVPLLKNGTEVLYESQETAVTILEGWIHKYYFNYYYIRENRSYVRVKAVMSDLEGCNYIAFKNRGNGDKWFFGFIDRLVYVNDNTVEIEFTIDPFPTYLGDTHYTEYGFIVRNTVLYDTVGNYLQEDYMPSSAKVDYHELQSLNVSGDSAVCYFCVSHPDLSGISEIYDPVSLVPTGIKVYPLISTVLDEIQQLNGVIIGAYLCPDAWKLSGNRGYPFYSDLGLIGGDPMASLPVGDWHGKIKTGVYNTIVLSTNQTSKNYQLELFDNRNSVYFQVVGLMSPCPSVFVYPKNYKGVEHNLAEGIYCKFPSIPISANSVYTYTQKTDDIYNGLMGIGTGALGGAVTGAGVGGVYGAAIGGIAGAFLGGLTGFAQIGKNQFYSKFNPPQVTGMGEPVVAVDGQIKIKVSVSRPSRSDLGRIQRYFDYYGYNISSEETIEQLGSNLNLSNNAYLQTGSNILVGSEMDAELNARLNSGIKIKRSLGRPV